MLPRIEVAGGRFSPRPPAYYLGLQSLEALEDVEDDDNDHQQGEQRGQAHNRGVVSRGGNGGNCGVDRGDQVNAYNDD